MSTAERVNQWIERSSDRINPILVKETRQALKSRQFLAAFMLLLAGSWVISVFGMLRAGDALQYGSTGRDFFFLYYLVLAVAIFLIVPFSAYRSLLGEREQNTFELLSITALSPRQVVRGKLLSALVQILLYYSAIAPFIAFTSLLEGFDPAQVAFILTASLLVALAVAMVALMLSTLVQSGFRQILLLLVLFGGLVWVLSGALTLVGTMLSGSVGFDDPGFWWATGACLAAVGSYFVLFQQITVAQLTFASDNRSTGIRLTAAAQFWLLWLGLISFLMLFPTAGFSSDTVVVFASLSALHWSAVGLFAATESDRLSRRVHRSLPKSRLLRLLMLPFLPGGARGFLYLLFHLMLLCGVSVVVAAVWDPRAGLSPFAAFVRLLTLANLPWPDVYLVLGLCCYVVFYVGIAAALSRWGQSLTSDFLPGHARVLAFLVFMGGVIVPYVPVVAGLTRWRGYTLLYVTNPFPTLQEVADGSGMSGPILLVLLLAGAAGILLNLRALKNGVTEILVSQATPRPEPEAPPAPQHVAERPDPSAASASS